MINFNFDWTFNDSLKVNLPHDFQIGQPWVAPDANERADNSDLAANVKSRLSARGFKEMVSASFDHELLRILIHGVLHLTGQADKTPETKTEMTRKEEEALLLIKN